MRWFDIDRTLLPNENLWGQGFGGKDYSPEDLKEIAVNIAGTNQEGYGPRLFIHTPGLHLWPQDITVPVGYDATGHPNRRGVDSGTMDPDRPTQGNYPWSVPDGLREYFRRLELRVDQHGRACHPLAEQLLSHPDIGLNTGIGYGHFLGESVVVDAVVRTKSSVLLTSGAADRSTIPSLPGGYSIPDDYDTSPRSWRLGHRQVTLEGIRATAIRKVFHETGLIVPGIAPMRIVRGIRPVSSPHTLNFWTVTYTVRFDVDDTAGISSWVKEGELDSVLPQMWPDHRRALLAAIG